MIITYQKVNDRPHTWQLGQVVIRNGKNSTALLETCWSAQAQCTLSTCVVFPTCAKNVSDAGKILQTTSNDSIGSYQFGPVSEEAGMQ